MSWRDNGLLSTRAERNLSYISSSTLTSVNSVSILFPLIHFTAERMRVVLLVSLPVALSVLIEVLSSATVPPFFSSSCHSRIFELLTNLRA